MAARWRIQPWESMRETSWGPRQPGGKSRLSCCRYLAIQYCERGVGMKSNTNSSKVPMAMAFRPRLNSPGSVGG